MPTLTTRTLNPLPFEALEPKRFEDLVRQLAYDFRLWRMLEATGRTGSDDGYDARGFEIVTELGDGPEPEEQEADSETSPAPTTDRIWLIQCKRERTIGPAKLRQHLGHIADEEARNLYGIVFAAACDFSKATRDELHTWCRERGISEVHIWGKGEIEDQLFQPKNDHLLFAYFGISLQIRRRSARTAIRSMLTMKRKVHRHLGDGEHHFRPILLRDPDEDQYPYIEEGADLENLPWCVVRNYSPRVR
jgi:Restriction endonuclease